MARKPYRELLEPETGWGRRLWWLERTSGWLSLGIIAATTIAMAIRDIG